MAIFLKNRKKENCTPRLLKGRGLARCPQGFRPGRFRHQHPVRADETKAGARGGVGRYSARPSPVHGFHMPGRDPVRDRNHAGGPSPPGSRSGGAGHFLEDFDGRVLPFDTEAAVAYADLFAAKNPVRHSPISSENAASAATRLVGSGRIRSITSGPKRFPSW